MKSLKSIVVLLALAAGWMGGAPCQAAPRARAADSVIILSADHGGHARTHGSNSPADMTIPWIVWGATVRPNFTITAPVTTNDTAATALGLLGVAVPGDWDGKPVISAFG